MKSVYLIHYSRLLTGIPILAVFQNLRWISNKTSSPEIQILDRQGHRTTHRKEFLETLHLGAPKVEHFPICKHMYFSKSSCWSCNYLNAKFTIHSNKASCFTFGLRAILCLPICLLNSTSLNLNND